MCAELWTFSKPDWRHFRLTADLTHLVYFIVILHSTNVLNNNNNNCNNLRVFVHHTTVCTLSWFCGTLPVFVFMFDNRADNVVRLYDRHGQQIQDIPLPGYDLSFWVWLIITVTANDSGCRVLSLSDRRYSLNPLSQTRIDWVGRYRIRWTFKLSCVWH